MVVPVIERNPLQLLRILEEGDIALRSYRLAECCRQHNISQDQFHKLRKEYVPFGKPIPFLNKENAMQYLRGQYDDCLQSLRPFLQEGPNQESEEMTTKTQRKLGRIEGHVQRGLDPELVECIALDLLEKPESSDGEIATRWSVSTASANRIRNANHPKLSDKLREMLMVRFSGHRASPQVIEWLAEIDKDPPQPKSNQSPALESQRPLPVRQRPIPDIIPTEAQKQHETALVRYIDRQKEAKMSYEQELKALRQERDTAIRERDEARAQLATKSNNLPATSKQSVRAIVQVMREAMRREGVTDIAFQSAEGTKIRVKREEEIMV